MSATDDTNATRRGSESNDLLGPVAEVKCGRLQWAIPRDDYKLQLRFLNNDTHPLYGQDALDAAVAAERERQIGLLKARLAGTVMSKYATKAECEAARAALRNAMLDAWGA